LTIFGYQVDLLLLLQIIVTAALVTLYLSLNSARESDHFRNSDTETILLVSFLFDHSKKYSDLAELTKADSSIMEDSTTHIHRFEGYFTNYREKGELPPEDYPGSSMLQSLVLILLGPFSSILLLIFYFLEARGRKFYRIEHTDYRKNLLSKDCIILFGSLIYLLVAITLLSNSGSWGWRILGIIILIFAVLGTAVTLGGLFILTRWQYEWKSFWQGELHEMMASASKSGNHDLFNRAIILRREINSEPDVPIPGALQFYVVTYSIVQVLLVWLSRNVSWL
jgi:hypothetical protein